MPRLSSWVRAGHEEVSHKHVCFDAGINVVCWLRSTVHCQAIDLATAGNIRQFEPKPAIFIKYPDMGKGTAAAVGGIVIVGGGVGLAYKGLKKLKHSLSESSGKVKPPVLP